MNILRLITVFAVAMFGPGTFNADALAASEPESVFMTAEAGVNGYYKPESWAPVKITVTSRGPAVEGVLRVWGRKLPAEVYEKQIRVPAGKSETAVMEIPGGLLNSDTRVTLLENGQEREEIPLKGTPHIGVMVGTIGEKNLFSFMDRKEDPYGGRVNVQSLSAADVGPLAALDSLDVIVINDPALTLSPEQTNALRQWVELGGTLVAGHPFAAAAQADQADGLKDLLPFTSNGLTQTNLNVFNRYAPGSPLSGVLTVAKAQSADGKVLLEEGETVLVAAKKVGLGQVIRTAYDLQASSLVSWDGNSELWERILFGNRSLAGKNMPKGEGIGYLTGPSRYLPQLQLVPIGTAIVVILMYVLIAGPGIYFVLRRRDKREWGWLAVPSLALLSTGGILAAGLAARNDGPINQAAGVVEIANPHFARVEAAHSFVVRNGGDYEVEAAADTLLRPFGGGGDRSSAPLMRSDQQKQVAYFSDVDYMTLRQALVKGAVRNPGEIEADLSVQEGTLAGTITNRTRFALRDVRMVVGSRVIVVPDLPVGKSEDILVQLENRPGPPDIDRGRPYPADLMPVGAKGWGIIQRYDQILDYANRRTPFENGAVTLLGWTEDPLDTVTVRGQPNERGALYLVRQELALKYKPGSKVLLPVDLLPSRVVEITGGFGMDTSSVKTVGGQGQITIEMQTKPVSSLQVGRIRIQADETESQLFEKRIFNWKTRQWEEFPKSGGLTIERDRVDAYLQNGNWLRIQYRNPFPDHRPVPRLHIFVEGEVAA